MPRKPRPIETNRYGAVFGRTPPGSRYRGSGRLFSDYYTRVCLRCGFAFCPPRHRAHRLEDCDKIIAEAKASPVARAHRNKCLYGTLAE